MKIKKVMKGNEPIWKPTLDMILGFFDSDGSFNITVEFRKKKTNPSVTYRFTAAFSQRKLSSDILESIKRVLKVKYKINDRTHNNKSGIGHSSLLRLEVLKKGTRSENYSPILMDTWAKNPPLAPTKHLDYLILMTLLEFDWYGKLGVFKTKLTPHTEKVRELAMLQLRYETHYNRTPGKKRTTLIEEHHETLGSSANDIKLGTRLGKEMFAKLRDQQIATLNNLVKNQLSTDYLIGYIIGDGSFWTVPAFNLESTRGLGFRAGFHFSIGDAIENISLLKHIKDKLHKEIPSITTISLYVSKAGTSLTLQIGGQKNCEALMQFLGNPPLPAVRKNQFYRFRQALILYPKVQEDPSLLLKFIRLHWSINPNSNRKKGSLSEDLKKGKQILARIQSRKKKSFK